MDLFPAFHRLRDSDCLVIGGGEAAARKAELLRSAGARVGVVAPVLGPGLRALAAAGEIRHRRRWWRPEDLERVRLVVVATGEEGLDRAAAAAARARGLPVNVVDRPRLGTFEVPAIVDRSPVVAAVSTAGAAPVLARLLRARLETLIPAGYGRLARLAGRLRERVRRSIASPAARRRFWEAALSGPAAELAFAGREAEATRLLERALESGPGAPARGEVYLVGAGPGDPELLTLGALRLMQQADVVVHDRLVPPAVLALVRRDARRVYAGKARGRAALSQGAINRLLVRLARRGERVLRLKGGDPLVFGRGGEEAEALAAAGVPFRIVPGVTAGSGCATLAGIPLTHRGHADTVVFTTGERGGGAGAPDWSRLAAPRQTLVVYMGIGAAAELSAGLVAAGRAAATPAAVIERGATPGERVIETTLGDLPATAAGERVRPPALIVIGEVVALRARLRPPSLPAAGAEPPVAAREAAG